MVFTGTDFQEVYDAFFIKEPDGDFTSKEDQIFQFLKSAIAKSYKIVDTSLEYQILIEYDGNFINNLKQDEIELLALFMQKEYLRQKLAPLKNLKTHIGSKDFNRLPEKTNEFKVLSQSIKDLDEEILRFRQEFNTYKG